MGSRPAADHTTPEGRKRVCRRPKKQAQGDFWDLATSKGWEVIQRGWPQFLISNGGKVIGVKVKPSSGRVLTEDEATVMGALSHAGLPCFVWSPDGGFDPVPSNGDVGGKGGSSTSSRDSTACTQETLLQDEGGVGETPPFDSPPQEVRRETTAEAREAVDRVWDHYAEVMQPRRKESGEEERKLIRSALKVASVEELCLAIDGCRSSDFHMGEADPGRYNGRPTKYNKLSQIIKGRRGRETTRERIDYFIDLAEKAVLGGNIPSGDPAKVNQKKLAVQRGWRFADDPRRVTEAEEAKAWLREHGIETVANSEGYPVFRSLRREG